MINNFPLLSKRSVRLLALCIVSFVIFIALAMNWSDARFYASKFLGIRISPIYRTADMEPVRFAYSGRENKPIIFNIPKAYLWSIVDQHSKGNMAFTGIEVVFNNLYTSQAGEIELNPYNGVNQDLFKFEADSIVEIMVRSPPLWLPEMMGLSETNRLNIDATSKANELGLKAIRSDSRVSDVPSIGNAIWKSEDTDIKWFMIRDFEEEEWVAKCKIFRRVVTAHPHWTCTAQLVDADGLEVRLRFPIRLAPVAPELRQAVDALLSQFRAPVSTK